MTHHSNGAERHEIFRSRKAEADRQFRAGEISEPVYTATLFGLGYRGQAITAERNLILWELQYAKCKSA